MTHIEKKFLDTKTVAAGIDTDERTLRNWIERGQYHPGGKKPAGRYEFSPYDLSVLAVVKPLVDFGVHVENAVVIADSVLKESSGFKAALKHAHVDAPGAFSARLLDTVIRITRVGKQNWDWEYAEKLQAQDAFIEIRVGFVVRDALRRAGLLAPFKGKAE